MPSVFDFACDAPEEGSPVSFQLSLSTELVTAAYPSQPLLVASDATVGEVVQLMRTQRNGNVLICDEGHLLGIFTDRDALLWMAAGKNWSQAISEAMTPNPVTLDSQATMGEAIQMMAKGRYRHLPILGPEGMPQGMANVHGILQYFVDHFPNTIYNLPPTPRSAPAQREGA